MRRRENEEEVSSFNDVADNAVNGDDRLRRLGRKR